jgi:hypothetical protein
VLVVGTATQVVVLVMETEVVTQPLRKVEEVVVVQTMAVYRNESAVSNSTQNAGARNDTIQGLQQASGFLARPSGT